MGGLLKGTSCLLRGGPGTGKTTLGLHFLLEGEKLKETVLFISLEESEQQIKNTAIRMGFDTSNISFLDLSPTSEYFVQLQSYDIFSASEVERDPIAKSIVEVFESLCPKRVFIDPLTQFRYLSPDKYQFHKQVLSLIRFLTDRGSTVMLSSECSSDTPDDDLQFLSHAVLQLKVCEHLRSVSVIKYRSSDFIPGKHSYKLTANGAVVYPRLNPVEYRRNFEKTVLSTGIAEMDMLLYGGIERGTINMLSGPTGVGKTTLGMQIIYASASRGEKSVLFSFEEEIEMIQARCHSIGINVKDMINSNLLYLYKIEPFLYSPDHFASTVRNMVDQNISTVMIDSTSGYNVAVKGEKLIDHLHVLCKYLQNMGVTVILTTELSNITGDFRIAENGISYLSDNVIFIRYLEIDGELKKAIGILKKRLSNYEKTLRAFEITAEGIKIGAPLKNLRGILRGEPYWLSNE